MFKLSDHNSRRCQTLTLERDKISTLSVNADGSWLQSVLNLIKGAVWDMRSDPFVMRHEYHYGNSFMNVNAGVLYNYKNNEEEQEVLFFLNGVYTLSANLVKMDLLSDLWNGSAIKSSCGHGTKAVIQTHKSINKWRIRMFRPTDMDPRIKGVIRHPRIVSITW